MDRSRSKLDIIGVLQKRISDAFSQIETLRNQNLALPDWIVPTLAGTWVSAIGVNTENPAYWRNSAGIVMLRGAVKSGGVGTTIFTLPVGFRPAKVGGSTLNIKYIPVVVAGALGYVSVRSDGTVVHELGSTTYVDLSSISFRAEQ